MSPDIAFGMEFGRLRDSFHGSDLGQNFSQQAGSVEKFEASAGAAFSKDAREFVAHTFGGNTMDGGFLALDRGKGVRLNIEFEACGKTHRAEEAKVILAKSLLGISDRPDQAGLEIGAS